jgi:hypothetical protein
MPLRASFDSLVVTRRERERKRKRDGGFWRAEFMPNQVREYTSSGESERE